MSAARSTTVGKVATGEKETLFLPRGVAYQSRRAILFCHQYGGDDIHFVNDPTGYPNCTAMASALCDAGFVCLSADLGGPNGFGNDTQMARIASARTLLATTGCLTDKILLVGMSMGGITALRYAADNPGQVAAFAGFCPAMDLNNIRDNNIASARTDINASWGLGASSTSATVPLPARGNLALRGADLAGLNARLWYSSADVLLPVSAMTQTVNLIGSATASMVEASSTAAHGDPAVVMPPADVLSFLLPFAA